MSLFTLRTFIFDHGAWENLISNCSIKSFEEWRAQSVPNMPIGMLYLFMGTIFELCIIDVMVLPCNAIIPGIQTLFGLHFCTCPALFFMTGYISSDSVQSSQEALSEGLELPETSSDGRIVTLNNYGAMKLGAVFAITTTKFIEIASTPGTAVLDIGAAYGETCLEALKRGATDYTANDIEPKHLKILARRVAEDLPSKLPNLKLISGGIPHPKFNDFIPTSSLDAVLLDSILHFLDPVQVTEALHQIFSWLKPGGKVFALMGTINLAVFKSEVRESLEQDVKTFVENVKTQGQIDPKDIPGFTSNVSEDFDFSICPKETLEAQFNFTDGRFFRFHLETAKYLFETAGFIIEEIVYTPINTFPYKLNGRERVAVFAKKP